MDVIKLELLHLKGGRWVCNWSGEKADEVMVGEEEEEEERWRRRWRKEPMRRKWRKTMAATPRKRRKREIMRPMMMDLRSRESSFWLGLGGTEIGGGSAWRW